MIKIKHVIQFFGIVGAVCAFTMFCLENSFIWSPTKPRPSTGEIVPYTYKGILHFITHLQYIEITAIYWGFYIGGGMFALLVIINGYKRGWRPGDKEPVNLD